MDTCSICSGELQLLGALGKLNHYRCRNCGMLSSGKNYDFEYEGDRHGSRMARKKQLRSGKILRLRSRPERLRVLSGSKV